VAARFKPLHVRVSAAAPRECLPPVTAGGGGDAAPCPAFDTADRHTRAERAGRVRQGQLGSAADGCIALMDELHVRKIVEVAILANDDESSWDAGPAILLTAPVLSGAV